MSRFLDVSGWAGLCGIVSFRTGQVQLGHRVQESGDFIGHEAQIDVAQFAGLATGA